MSDIDVAKPGPLIARFDVRAFRFIARFAPDEAARYYLSGVHIEPASAELGGVIMVATDGSRLGALHDPHGFAARHVTVTTPDYAGFAAMIEAQRSGWVSMHQGFGEDARVFFAHFLPESDHICEAALGEENGGSEEFPEWRQVVPWGLLEDSKPSRADFDWNVVEPFAAHFEDPTENERRGELSQPRREPVFLGDQPNEPQIVLRHDIPDFIGIAMPLLYRGDQERDHRPSDGEWVRRLSKLRITGGAA